MKPSKTIGDRAIIFLFAGPALPLGLAVLMGMASGDHRYLPEWAPTAIGWVFGVVATATGALAFWSALRK